MVKYNTNRHIESVSKDSYNDSVNSNYCYTFFKRLIDIIGSLCGIILLLPIFIITAIAIKIDSKGPVINKSTRIGKLNKNIYIYRFRTIYLQPETNNSSFDGLPIFKASKDPRITKVGRFIRKTSLDELPQLFNIIKGDLSLVGPRPALPYELELNKEQHAIFNAVKPGLTGLWQISENISFEEKYNYDLEYTRNASLLMDFKIIFQTMRVVFKDNVR